ncbi:MAG: hypothetical protein SF052_01685 [Bacteroidia bacterium]|nr:hypothetical protein [Bacteroidia bacterium]
MKNTIEQLKTRLQVSRKTLIIYVVLYFCWGIMMNYIGQITAIARFTWWWQVITCYILYMIPISLLVRDLKWYEQYAYGLVAMALLEFGGYWLETSYAYPDNILDKVFGIRNFSLGMAIFFGFYFPLGNWAVGKLESLYDKIQHR